MIELPRSLNRFDRFERAFRRISASPNRQWKQRASSFGRKRCFVFRAARSEPRLERALRAALNAV